MYLPWNVHFCWNCVVPLCHYRVWLTRLVLVWPTNAHPGTTHMADTSLIVSSFLIFHSSFLSFSEASSDAHSAFLSSSLLQLFKQLSPVMSPSSQPAGHSSSNHTSPDHSIFSSDHPLTISLPLAGQQEDSRGDGSLPSFPHDPALNFSSFWHVSTL